MHFLSSVLVLLLIIACADSSLTNLTFPKLHLEHYGEILLRAGHLIEWTLRKNVPYVKGEKRQDSEGQKKKICVWTHACKMSACVSPCKAGGQHKVRSRATLFCGMGSSKRGRGWGGLGCLPRPQGLSKAAHTCSDMQQIVSALPSYAWLMSSDSTRSRYH